MGIDFCLQKFIADAVSIGQLHAHGHGRRTCRRSAWYPGKTESWNFSQNLGPAAFDLTGFQGTAQGQWASDIIQFQGEAG